METQVWVSYELWFGPLAGTGAVAALDMTIDW